jgi:hypothetical protein
MAAAAAISVTPPANITGNRHRMLSHPAAMLAG